MKEKLIVSITDFGAVPDAGLQTDRIQAAIDHCFLKGGGEVQVPAGLFRTGGIRLRSRVTLHLLENAVLEASRDWRDYDVCERDTIEPLPDEEKYRRFRGRWNHGLIKAVDAEDIAIIGEKGAVIDGRDCYDPEGEEAYRGPHGVHMCYCRNITFRGYTIKNTGNWAHCIYLSENMSATNLTALGGHDGFHARGSKNIIVEDCVFHTGDDCIAGCANINVTIRNCEMNSSCNDLRLGGTNVLVEHCRAWGPGIYGHRYTMTKEEQASSAPTNASHRHNTFGFFTYLAENVITTPCLPGNILVRDCTVENIDRFYQFNFTGSDVCQVGQPLKNIRFEDIRVTNIRNPIVAYSNDEVNTILEMRNMTYAMAEGCEMVDVIQAANFERISLHDVKFTNVKSGHLIKAWDDQGVVEVDGLEVDGGIEQIRVLAAEPFSARDM